jgi:hypothetical protein
MIEGDGRSKIRLLLYYLASEFEKNNHIHRVKCAGLQAGTRRLNEYGFGLNPIINIA